MEDINMNELMHWLWNKDREKYTLILFGHYEVIDEKMIEEFKKENVKEIY